MIAGVGADIVKIARIESVLARQSQRFVDRILAPEERNEFSASQQPARFLAKRFAVKEAASKALGTGIARGVSWHDFYVEHDHLGAPSLQVRGVAAELAAQRSTGSWHVSISDEEEHALAFVILS